MAFDIYGNRLKPGYCEVHPDYPESYPCQLCFDEQKERQLQHDIEHFTEEQYSQYINNLLLQEANNAKDS